jgi:FSR family fosmidomycin resistance protein-like MFS transporter
LKNKTAGFATGLVLLVAGAHFVHDVFTALLAPLLPLLIEKLELSLFQAGSLAVLNQIPSVFNPLLGSLVDRKHLYRLLVAIGPGGSGTLMCLIGLAPSYVVLAILLLTAGISVASLHVAAPVVISRVSGSRIGRGMSLFMVAGELARTVGPLVAVQLVSSFGLEGMWQVAPVAILSSAVLWWRLGNVEIERSKRPPLHLFAVWSEMRHVFVAVTGILVSRAFMAGALATFLPTFVYGEGESLWTANISLSIFELAGAAGALTSGTISDRLGRRTVLLATVALSPPLLVLFLNVDGPLRLGVLVLLGFAMLSTAPVLMALVLENAGDNPAAANGTYFMISFAARALVLLAVGALADVIGLRAAYFWCAGFAVFGIPFVLMLPRSGRGD